MAECKLEKTSPEILNEYVLVVMYLGGYPD